MNSLACPHRLDWVICGGETGPYRRHMEESWARSLRDQCQDAGVAFFMKQMTGMTSKSTPIPDDLMIQEFPPTLGQPKEEADNEGQRI
jgi:protein gp37